ncbi:MAG: S49 family peptidase [Gammaproteobacteria bacterium]|nr:S49 family peptidase [Gammaproteobacteria bacterium]
MTPLAHHVFNTPLLVQSAKLDAIVAGLGERLITGNKSDTGAYLTNPGSYEKPGYFVNGGIATIEIRGILAHHGGVQADSSYVLGYQTISRQLTAAINDSTVKGILIIFDSPGGQVAGCLDLASDIRKASAIKPVWASVSDLAASAAYWLASACDRIYATQTAMVGSIGVVMRHIDMSRALDKAGLGVTFVHAGKHKVDGHSYAPLPDGVKADMQAVIDRIYSMFVGAVAEYRGIDPASVRSTEAQIYMGAEAITRGLADHTGTPNEAQAALAAYLKTGVLPMTTETAQKHFENDRDSAAVQSLWDKIISTRELNNESVPELSIDPQSQDLWDKVISSSPTSNQLKSTADAQATAMATFKKSTVNKKNDPKPDHDQDSQALWDKVIGRGQ